MSFRALICESCGDSAHPEYGHRRMIGTVGSILIHDDCCYHMYHALLELGDGANPIAERFRIHGPHWPSTNGTSNGVTNEHEHI